MLVLFCIKVRSYILNFTVAFHLFFLIELLNISYGVELNIDLILLIERILVNKTMNYLQTCYAWVHQQYKTQLCSQKFGSYL